MLGNESAVWLNADVRLVPTIPKGLRPAAQGCEQRATLGARFGAALPLEFTVIPSLFSQPDIRDAFQFLHPFSLRNGASKSREQMDVVFHPSNKDGRAIELFGDAAEIRVERIAHGFVPQERSAVFGGEDQMNVNGGQGLWHERKMAT